MLIRQVSTTTDAGLGLPVNMINYRMDLGRMRRVISKVVRGLYFLETGLALPLDTQMVIRLFSPDVTIPEGWQNMLAAPLEDKGANPDVFAYRCDLVAPINLWLMLIWDRFIVGVMYERPDGHLLAQTSAGTVRD